MINRQEKVTNNKHLQVIIMVILSYKHRAKQYD